MNKNIYQLLLTTLPLLFSACNSTTVQNPTPIEEKIQIVSEATVTDTQTKSSTMAVNYANDNEQIRHLGNLHINSYLQTMQPTLKGLMKSDPTHQTAMGACSTLGQGMSNDYNKVSDVKIKRTALKYRNPINQPDHTDTVVMERFLASNDFKKSLVVDMGNNYRVYKALEIKQPCLACHGSNISSDLKAMLVKKYPADLATNFKLGEFRGVVVAEITK